MAEKFVEKLFFLIIFGFRAEKFEQLVKKYSQDCQNSIQSLQRNIFRTFLWNEELCSRFLVVERIYWIFGVNFLSNFSKLQPTRAAECFEALLERSVILWSFLVSERKLPYLGKKFRQFAKLHFTCPQQNFEKKWLKYFSLLSSLLDFQWVLSDFGKKISQVCWNSNLSVQGKTVKSFVEQIVFRLFWILTRKACVFAGKFLAGLSKILWTCPVEHLQINISEWKSWKLEDFRIIFEVFGTMPKKKFSGLAKQQ